MVDKLIKQTVLNKRITFMCEKSDDWNYEEYVTRWLGCLLQSHFCFNRDVFLSIPPAVRPRTIRRWTIRNN